jgi:hypothetical protein
MIEVVKRIITCNYDITVTVAEEVDADAARYHKLNSALRRTTLILDKCHGAPLHFQEHPQVRTRSRIQLSEGLSEGACIGPQSKAPVCAWTLT